MSLVFYRNMRRQLKLEDNLDWNGNFPQRMELIPISDGMSYMEKWMFDYVLDGLRQSKRYENPLSLRFMALRRAEILIKSWDGKPEITERYKS